MYWTPEDAGGRFLFQSPHFNVQHSPRFLGTDPEPRPGLSSGHIPNSFSLPFNTFLQNNVTPDGVPYTTFLSEPEQLRSAVVDALGADRAKAVFNGDVPVIASCGSGMTAAVLWLGMKLMGVNQISIYDEVSMHAVKKNWSDRLCSPGPVMLSGPRAK